METCRGEEKKQKLVAKYDLTPLMHIDLSAYDKQTCCCGDKLENESDCYIFRAVDKTNKSNIFTFYAGAGSDKSCATKLLELTGNQPLPKINLFADNISNTTNPIGRNSKQSLQDDETTFRQTWDPLNLELYKAIYILLKAWNTHLKEDSTLANILSFITSKPNRRTQEWTVLKVNKIIGTDRAGRNIHQMISSVEHGNKKVKKINFPEIIKVIENERKKDPTITNYFTNNKS